jgi:hypothetical protein
MPDLETDYLVVGAGASGMAFVDAVISESEAEVILLDRRHRPGGHWLDAYPFVRLHQPSAYYGVPSTPFGDDRIDTTGVNTGFYERATAAEICSYFDDVLEKRFLASGRVRFLPMCDYRGADDGHRVVSLLSGEEYTIRVRRRVVDATYVESSIPSRHTPTFAVDSGVRLVAPNDLVDLGQAPSGFTVLGCGKTAMDTCNWLLDTGVAPDRIQWVRPRDPWLFDRVCMQPLELVGAYVQMQARWVEACAHARDGRDFAHRLEGDGVFVRIDSSIEPDAFRGATISSREIRALATIERVVRAGKVRRLSRDRMILDDGEMSADPRALYVDCSAHGVRPTAPRPVYERDRITLQYVTIGIVPWSAATIGLIEVLPDDDAEKNRLCPAVRHSGDIADVMHVAYTAMTGNMARSAEPDVAAWNGRCRLDPARAATGRTAEPDIAAAFDSVVANFMPAMHNLSSKLAARVRSEPPDARAI